MSFVHCILSKVLLFKNCRFNLILFCSIRKYTMVLCMFNELRWYVIVHFEDIGRIVLSLGKKQKSDIELQTIQWKTETRQTIKNESNEPCHLRSFKKDYLTSIFGKNYYNLEITPVPEKRNISLKYTLYQSIW